MLITCSDILKLTLLSFYVVCRTLTTYILLSYAVNFQPLGSKSSVSFPLTGSSTPPLAMGLYTVQLQLVDFQIDAASMQYFVAVCYGQGCTVSNPFMISSTAPNNAATMQPTMFGLGLPLLLCTVLISLGYKQL